MARQGSNGLRLVVWTEEFGVESVSGWSFRCHRFKFWWCYLNRAETHGWNFNSLGRIMVLNNGGVPICL
jgi:hypothetical protein